MGLKKYFDLLCILFGAVIAIYANAEKSQNSGLLIAGISLLMIGIYRVSSRVPSKKDTEENDDISDI